MITLCGEVASHRKRLVGSIVSAISQRQLRRVRAEGRVPSRVQGPEDTPFRYFVVVESSSSLLPLVDIWGDCNTQRENCGVCAVGYWLLVSKEHQQASERISFQKKIDGGSIEILWRWKATAEFDTKSDIDGI